MSENGEDESNLNDRLRDAECRVFSHPGYREYILCEAFRQTLDSVFLRNWRELIALLERPAADANLAVELFQNMYRPDVREAFQAETAQRLHNYVAATMTLVDHSRRIMRDRSGSIAEELVERKSVLLSNPEVPFIQDLRNFTLHRSLPFLGHTVRVTDVNTPGQTITAEIELSVADLKAWDGWSAPVRAFLDSQGEAVVLRPLVRRHGELVASLNAWLYNSLAKTNEAALAEVNRLAVERNAVLSGRSPVEAEHLTEALTRLRQTPRSDQPADPITSLLRRSPDSEK
jgi:hypothetical protein